MKSALIKKDMKPIMIKLQNLTPRLRRLLRDSSSVKDAGIRKRELDLRRSRHTSPVARLKLGLDIWSK